MSFTHIVKASEPVVSAALSAVMLGAFYSPITYLTLLPIVGGVALASLKELSFTWLGFGAAMLVYSVIRFERVTSLLGAGKFSPARWGPVILAGLGIAVAVGATILLVV